MLDKLKSIAKDTAWLTIGATAAVVYITYKAVDNMVKDVPEMMDFAQDTYSQVKDVITKNSKGMPFAGDYDTYQDYVDAVKNAGYTINEDKE